jgi:hypothetical protein
VVDDRRHEPGAGLVYLLVWLRRREHASTLLFAIVAIAAPVRVNELR